MIAGSPLAFVGISPRREVGVPSMGNSFPSLGAFASHAEEKCLLPLGGGATSVSFPYYVIGDGKVDLYWSLGEPI